MRTIKFRAFDKVKEKMHDVVSIWNNTDGSIAHVVIALNEDYTEVDTLFSNYELMKFTGLTDKNGKDIYEGDIIRYPTLYETPEMCNTQYSNDAVVFENGGFYLGQYNEETLLYCEMKSYDGDFEVIGNVHENKQLLS